MKTLTLSFSMFLLIVSSVFSQTCPPNNIVFTTQQEIDSFPINYPGCEIIEGSVGVSGEYITNLHGLLGVKEIHGGLFLGGMPGIDVTDLSGLDSLTSIGGVFDISYCFHLENLHALANLRSIGSNLQLFSLLSLEDLSGLNGLTEIGGNLSISDCSVQSLSGLQNLENIGGSIKLRKLRYIENLDSLQQLHSISGKLEIIYTSLSDISALENIPADSITDLTLDYNNLLSYCHLSNICEYLENPNGGEVIIVGNAAACNSPEEVIYECLVGNENVNEPEKSLKIVYNPGSSEIIIKPNTMAVSEIRIYNQLGQLMLNEHFIKNHINIATLQDGIYIVHVISANSTQSKVIFKR